MKTKLGFWMFAMVVVLMGLFIFAQQPQEEELSDTTTFESNPDFEEILLVTDNSLTKLSYLTTEERMVADQLGLATQLKEAYITLEGLEQDYARTQEDSTLTEIQKQARTQSIGDRLQEIKDHTPKTFTIVDGNSYSLTYPEGNHSVLAQHLLRSHQPDVSPRIQTQFGEDSVSRQENALMSTKYKHLTVGYLSGKSEHLTLVTHEIHFKEEAKKPETYAFALYLPSFAEVTPIVPLPNGTVSTPQGTLYPTSQQQVSYMLKEHLSRDQLDTLALLLFEDPTLVKKFSILPYLFWGMGIVLITGLVVLVWKLKWHQFFLGILRDMYAFVIGGIHLITQRRKKEESSTSEATPPVETPVTPSPQDPLQQSTLQPSATENVPSIPVEPSFSPTTITATNSPSTLEEKTETAIKESKETSTQEQTSQGQTAHLHETTEQKNKQTPTQNEPKKMKKAIRGIWNLILPPKNTEIDGMRVLIKEFDQAIQAKHIARSEEVFDKLERAYQQLSDRGKNLAHKRMQELTARLALAKLKDQIENAKQHLEEGKIDDAIQQYSIIQNLYKELPSKGKAHVADQCHTFFQELQARAKMTSEMTGA